MAYIVFATLSPIGLRPTTHTPVNLERFGAYGLLGALFAIGYPKARQWVLVGLSLGAMALEAGQNLSPTRHGRVEDAIVKIAGGLCGLTAVTALEALSQRRKKLAQDAPEPKA